MKKSLISAGLCLVLSTAAFGFFGGSKGDRTPLQEDAAKTVRARNIRVVIGSTSTGGDTYQVSNMVSQKLGEVLGKNVKVDPVGVFNAFDAIDRIKDGSTIMIFHDQSYLGDLYGVSGYRDIFNEFKIGPTLATNPGNGFSVKKDSPYNTPQDLIDAAGNGKAIRVAIQPGGASEIAFSALKNAVRIQYPGMENNMVAVNTGSQANKNQQLFDGLADVAHVSVQSNEQFNHLPANDQKAMKFIWLTSSKQAMDQLPSKGYGTTSKSELMQYASPKMTVKRDTDNDFIFDKDFFILYNQNTSEEVMNLYDKAINEVFSDEEFLTQLKENFFVPNHLETRESNDYVTNKANDYKEVIEAIK